MDETLRFLLNGEAVEVRDAPPTTTLLDWLRYDRGLTGTKEGCAEGDCGACTVAVREIGPGGALKQRTVNACIQLLPMMHGKEVITVEHLSAGGAPHPVQTAMATGHGSQCGFCTPGFVMSLWHGYETGAPTDEESVKDQLAGNLCRCTGYGPILRAAAAAREGGDAREDGEAARARLAALGAGPLDYQAGGGRFWAPRDADALAELVVANTGATILAGATDIGLWVTKQGFRPDRIIHLGDCADLKTITRGVSEDEPIEEDVLRIPAAVSHEDAMAALGALYPDMGELWRRFASAQVRSAGTLCGNIANGSPIGDAAPALIAAGARLALRRGDRWRYLALEDFFVDYGRQDLRAGEFVEAVEVPAPARPMDLRCYKISKRFDQDITAVLAAINIGVEDGVTRSARIAFGGMAATPKRARAAEAALLDKPFDDKAVAHAIRALSEDFQPMTDHRASADYRMTVARNLLLKYMVERVFGDQRVTGRGKSLGRAA